MNDQPTLSNDAYVMTEVARPRGGARRLPTGPRQPWTWRLETWPIELEVEPWRP